MTLLGSIIKKGMQVRSRMLVQDKAPIAYQQKVLNYLLRKAKGTAFGQHYHFDKILQSENPIQSFQEAIPIHDYNAMYNQWWHRALAQEPNVAWPGKMRYFALSSGTSGAPSKHIPVSLEMQKAIRRVGINMFNCLVHIEVDDGLYCRDMMMLGGCADLEDKGGYFMGDLSGINTSRLPFWLRRFYRPGVAIAKLKDWETRIDEIAKEAPRWDVGFLMGIPAWIQLLLQRIIKTHNLTNIHDIWPNLEVYVGGGVAFEPYRRGFDQLLGRPIHFLDTYLASEGFIAFQRQPEGRGMELVLDNGLFYEFIPFKKYFKNGQLQPGAKALTIEEAEEGTDYALVISTCAGAWRYLIGDTIRFTNKSKCELIITGRTHHFLSLCGEHLSIDNMNRALEMLEEKHNLSIPEFTVSGIAKEQFFAHKWYLGTTTHIPKEKLICDLDYFLRMLNDDYATERGVVLKDPELEIIPVDVFYQWQAAQGKMGGQNKFPRVMQKEAFANWEQFVKASKNPVS